MSWYLKLLRLGEPVDFQGQWRLRFERSCIRLLPPQTMHGYDGRLVTELEIATPAWKRDR